MQIILIKANLIVLGTLVNTFKIQGKNEVCKMNLFV